MTDVQERPSATGTAAKTAGKTVARHGARKLFLLVGAKVWFWIAVAMVLLLLIMVAASATSSRKKTATCGGQPVAVTGSLGNLTAEQNQNAQTIAGVALGLGLGRQGVLVGIVTALTESTLINVDYGDIQNGSMTSSRGLFQQIAAWGPLEDRTDPVKSATMFYTGGQAGQRGLTDIAGWEQMSVPAAAQAVEQSEFADGSNYAKNLELGTVITDSLIPAGSSTASASPTPVCGAAPGAGTPAAVNGVQVTIPDNEFVAEAVRGKVITAPTAGMARGLAAGFAYLGYAYVWGGSDANGGGPDEGCARGGFDLNACQGEVGFDCSGYTAYVIVAAGYPGPGTNSAAQRNPAHGVDPATAQPGTIVGFPGHVAIFLGIIDGRPYILEASTVGTPLHIVELRRTDADPVYYQYFS